MKAVSRWTAILAIAFNFCGCTRQQAESQSAAAQPTSVESGRSFTKVRGPAVAGLFYPKAESELKKVVDEDLAEAKTVEIKNLRALVCPHAGYEYSGKVAASAYKQLAGRDFKTVILLGPSHYARFEGAALPDAKAYETPFGQIPISAKVAELAKLKPFAINPPSRVQRPEFWRQSPKELPAFGEDTPDTWEHSLEVQLPFLQRTLKDFEIVPVVYGDVDPLEAAKVLMKFVDDRTLIIASSDLSHYYPYGIARQLDDECARTICDLNAEEMDREEACGKVPIITLLEIARQKGWKAKLLDARNSGDTSGTKDKVVGYAAVAFYEPEANEKTPSQESRAQRPEFTPQQRKLLLKLARDTITQAVNSESLPEANGDGMADSLRAVRACFVTLTKHGDLRGCIGSIMPQEPLNEAVVSRARAAALDDPRFSPVRPEELKDIEVEISVLTIPRPLEFKSPDDLLRKLRPNIDGVVLIMGRRNATYLPQVWEQIPDKVEFLNHLAEKAGADASAWREPGTGVLIYQVEAFKQSDR
jgi:MEMO1 family protein